MINGQRRIGRRRALAGIAAAGLLLAGCETGATGDRADGAPDSATPSAPAPSGTVLGPDGYGTIRPGVSEREALAGGDLQTPPIWSVDGRNYYLFAGGPAPDPALIAEEDRAEAEDRAARTNPHATAAPLTTALDMLEVERRMSLEKTGGVIFWDGTLHRAIMPEGVTTEKGITRGSTAGEAKAAYGDALAHKAAFAYTLPASKPNWSLHLIADDDVVISYIGFGRDTW